VLHANVVESVAAGRRTPGAPHRCLTAFVGAVLAAGALTGCGGATQDETAATVTPAGKPDVQRILDYVGPIEPKSSGKGLQLQLGVTVALTGPGSLYGVLELNGARLAAKQIQELGGPAFTIVQKDNQSATPAASVKAAEELGLDKVPVALSTYGGGLGAMLPNIARYETLTLDGGGGASSFLGTQGKPYFWGTRAVTPLDTYPGVVKYMKASLPSVKKVTMVAWDLGPANAALEAETRTALAAGGMELAGYETVQIGATDYATAIQRVRDQRPDALWLGVYGLDLANFHKQYVSSGIGKPTFGFDFTDEAAKAAGPALNDYRFAYDYLDPQAPPNPWAKVFVDSYRAAYGKDPNYLAANFYEDVFVVWDLVRRVLAKGGSPNSGAELQQALVADPTFKSVYGGDETHSGALSLDPTTHSVKARPMGLLHYDASAKEAKLVATFNIDGADFRQP
jgi:branched-chain amino acid transport system substrate-binding protein